MTLGTKITRTSEELVLSQSYYIEKVLKKFNTYDNSPARITVDANLHLTKNKGKSIS